MPVILLTKEETMKKVMRMATAAVVLLAVMMLAGCASTAAADNTVHADTVVYGKIYTSNADQEFAEAFAVKDGKYVYVGDADGVSKYIGDDTLVIDRRGQGLILAGATEGHGHYVVASELAVTDIIVGGSNIEEILSNMREHVAKYPDKEVYFTQGWETGGEMSELKYTYNMRAELDSICPDRPIIMLDSVGHNAFLNSKAFEIAGIDSSTVVEGGAIAKDEDGNLLGLVSDVAANYAMAQIVSKTSVISVEEVRKAILLCADTLHANGYTNYFDAYTSMLGEETYAGIKEEDEENGLTFNIISAYKVDPFENIDEKVALTKEYKEKYSSTHFKADNIKLFADGGAVEVGTGWMLEPYVNGSHGNQVWTEEKMFEIVKKANENGLSVHVHASGDGGTTLAVEAFINAEDTAAEGVYNGLGHSRHITEEIKDKMAEHNIYSATNVCWRYMTAVEEELIPELLMDIDRYKAGYPMKSLLEKGIVMTSSTDYPASDGAPTDICSIVEIGVNGTIEGLDCVRMNEDEYLTVIEMLDVMTINGAKQFQLEDERGSIEVGKYADFIILDKDITTCEKDKIHEGKVETVYFEGKEVYTLN